MAMQNFRIPLLIIPIILFLFLSTLVQAQWPALSAPNLPVSITSGNEHNYWACTDGKGGSIVVWEDDRSGHNDIYAQRIDKDGVVMWNNNGIAISIVAGHQHGPKIIYDGNGGAVMAWRDERGGSKDIYAQKIDSNGVVQWTANGVAICTEGSDQEKVELVSDGAGGAIIAWEDTRNDRDIYAQLINVTGAVQWTVDGITICDTPEQQKEIDVVNDSLGGAVLTWTDTRSGSEDIYAQRVNSTGMVLFTANGVVLCASANKQYEPKIAADGNGNFVVAWNDGRAGDDDIYAQMINSVGTIQWTLNGVVVCGASNIQKKVNIIGDELGSVIMTWEDERGATKDIYAQKLNDMGSPQWAVDGIVVSAAGDDQKNVHMTSATKGRAFIIWEDKRSGVEDIYVQILDSNGVALLAANGLIICSFASKQVKPFLFFVGDLHWISVWTDERNGNKDLYAQGYTSAIIAALPINLLCFEPKVIDEDVRLKWITSSEINNDYFTLERSVDAKEWEEIMIVSGAGNSTNNIEYSELDRNPINGVSYYRLKQTDFDGTFTHSTVRMVKIDKEIDAVINVFPNPARNYITVEGDESEFEKIDIHNVVGQNINNKIKVVKISKTKAILDLINLNAGMYFIKTKTITNRFFKE